LKTIGGEPMPLVPGSPRRISGVSIWMTPRSPNASFGLPVLASSEYILPSFDPNTICGGVWPSPGQYSTPRVAGFPEGSWNAQRSWPVVGSTATTRK
jgi:hypothetical protein